MRVFSRKALPLWLVLMFVIVGCDTTPGGTALQNPSLPSLTTETGWVVDPADAMSNETEQVLEAVAESIDRMDEGFQLGIAIFSNCACDTVDFATEFGNHNGIGSAENDNGIAIAVFVDKSGGDGNSPAIGVAVGSGGGGVLNAAKVGRMLDQLYVPLRADGDWEQGLIDFVQALETVLNGEDGEQFAPEPTNWTLIIILIIVIVILLICDVVFLDGAFIGAMASGSGGGGGSIGGGGGFSGGGAGR